MAFICKLRKNVPPGEKPVGWQQIEEGTTDELNAA